MDMKYLNWIEIDSDAVIHNVNSLSRLAGPRVSVAAATKANGYGHGLAQMVQILRTTGVDYLALHSTAEADAARSAGWNRKIMLVGGIAPEDIDAVEADRFARI